MLFSADAEPYTVRNGDSGTDVKSIQERLKELKYFSGEITGEFGDRTETAVKNFQKRNGLSPDGIVGEETREALYSDSARSASGSGGSSGGGGGSHGGGTTIATWEPDSAKVEALIAFAQTLLGKTYVQGGKGPDVFDCSGFVYYSLNHSGYSIGYMTSSGWAKCSLPKVTSMSDLRRGDIICFKGHVGIYLGGGQMIDASSTQGQVRISTNVLTSSYWKRYFICARRLF
jgi:cell wall-associated NlpC family hydrolase